MVAVGATKAYISKCETAFVFVIGGSTMTTMIAVMNKEELINERCKEVQEEGACFGCCFECPINYGRGLSEDWYNDDDDDFDWDDED